MAETSILFLSPTWKYDGYGIASINRSLIDDLWMADKRGTNIKMTCALLGEQDGNITQPEWDEARRHHVRLIGATLPRGMDKLPDIPEIDRYCSAFFRHFDFTRERITHIVGHMPYMYNAAFSMLDVFRFAGQTPKVVLVMHALPRKHSTVDMASLGHALEESDIVVSIGQPMYDEISQHIGLLQGAKPRHKVYIPGGPVKLLLTQRPSRSNLTHGPHNILVITGEPENTQAKGLDYDVAVAASTKATGNITYQNTIVQLLTVGTSQEERNAWESQFAKVKREVNTFPKCLNFEYQCFQDVPDLSRFFQLSSVCILPFRPYSTVYGIEGIWAAYAGTPLLVSSNTGLADFLQTLQINEPLIQQHGDLEEGQMLWNDEIKQRICHPVTARENASIVQQKCLFDISIARSHLELIRTILGNGLHW